MLQRETEPHLLPLGATLPLVLIFIEADTENEVQADWLRPGEAVAALLLHAEKEPPEKEGVAAPEGPAEELTERD